jgi:N-methylhydantoinase B
VHGGKEALPGRFVLVDAATGETRAIGKEKGLELAAGDLVWVETGGGGGYGPPSGRALTAIQRDLDAGYVSPAAAVRDYGVTIGPDKARRERL